MKKLEFFLNKTAACRFLLTAIFMSLWCRCVLLDRLPGGFYAVV